MTENARDALFQKIRDLIESGKLEFKAQMFAMIRADLPELFIMIVVQTPPTFTILERTGKNEGIVLYSETGYSLNNLLEFIFCHMAAMKIEGSADKALAFIENKK